MLSFVIKSTAPETEIIVNLLRKLNVTPNVTTYSYLAKSNNDDSTKVGNVFVVGFDSKLFKKI